MATIADKNNTTVDTTDATTSGPRSHIVGMPKPYFILRIVQFFVAVIILGIVGHLINVTFGGTFGQEVFALVAAVFTLIVILYGLIAEAYQPAFYNLWAVLALDALMTAFWLVAMAVLADLRATEHPFREECGYYFCFVDGANAPYLNSLAAAAGISGLEMLLFVASLVPFGMAVHKHRKSGAPISAIGRLEMGPADTTATPPAEQYVPPPQGAPFQHATPSYDQATANISV